MGTIGQLPCAVSSLSPREVKTLELLCCGLSEKQIALSLELSVHTVHVYVKQVYRKFGVNTRSELLSKVFQQLLASQNGQFIVENAMVPGSAKHLMPPASSNN